MAAKPKAPIFPIRTTHLLMWVGILFLFGLFLRAVEPILLPFVLGMLMAYLFDPLADRLEARGISRGIAAAAITFSFFTLLVALVCWGGPLLYEQLAELVTKIPDFLHDAEAMFREKTASIFSEVNRITNGNPPEEIPSSSGEAIAWIASLGDELTQSVLSSSFAALNLLSLLLITPIVSFYLLRDWDSVVAKMDKLLPRAYAPIIRAQAQEVSNTLAGYLRGQLYVMFILSVCYVIIFAFLGLKYSLLIGVLAGTLVIIPYIGTWISAGVGLIVAYGQFGFESYFWIVASIFAVGQILESQILTPNIIGERVGLHPLWLLFGMLAGAVLIGFVGVLLAVPITAVIAVGVKFVVKAYLDSSLYKD